MSRTLLRNGAFASLGCATTFVFGFVLLLTQMMPYIGFRNDPLQAVNFVQSHYTVLSVWNFVIYLVFGVLLTILAIALYHRLSSVDLIMAQTASAFALVWITLVISSGMVGNLGLSRVVELAALDPEMAQSLWLSVITIKEGLGGSNELVGGLWVLLVSSVLWRNRIYSRILSVIGFIAGLAGIMSTVPLLGELGAVFGLLLIVWFVYLCFHMLRESAENQDQE